MDFKRIRKNISRFFAWVGLSFCSLIVKAIPHCCLYAFAAGISAMAYRIAGKQRKIAIDSLTIAFGQEKTRAEIEKIARDCFTDMAKSAAEIMFLMDRPSLLKARIGMTGKENLDAALAKGKGVILVSAHFGNFPLLLGKLSIEGYKIAAIMRVMRDERVEKMFAEMRRRLNIKTIYSQPRRTCVEETLRSLRGSEVVFIPIDQNFGTGGVFVDFFGTKAATAPGPVIIARRTGAVILPCFIVRQADDTHRIIFERPIALEEGRTAEETVAINIQKLTGIIETYIRRYPAEWGWIHRRWKSKPKP